MAVNATSAPSNGMSPSDVSPCELDTPSKPAPPSAMPYLPLNDQDVREPPAKDDGGAEGAKKRRGRMTKEEKDTQVAASAELDEAFLETFDPATDSLLQETAPEDCLLPEARAAVLAQPRPRSPGLIRRGYGRDAVHAAHDRVERGRAAKHARAAAAVHGRRAPGRERAVSVLRDVARDVRMARRGREPVQLQLHPLWRA
jgi:hypothetical protein